MNVSELIYIVFDGLMRPLTNIRFNYGFMQNIIILLNLITPAKVYYMVFIIFYS